MVECGRCGGSESAALNQTDVNRCVEQKTLFTMSQLVSRILCLEGKQTQTETDKQTCQNKSNYCLVYPKALRAIYTAIGMVDKCFDLANKRISDVPNPLEAMN